MTSYLRYLGGNAQGNLLNGRFVGLLAEEAMTKAWRYSNLPVRRRFDAALASDYVRTTARALPKVRVCSLCHGGGTPEQKLSILSFIHHVGAPERWTVVSDGSITAAQADALRAIHRCIEVVPWTDFIDDANRACVEEFAKYTVFAKKLALESNLPVEEGGSTVYTDTDIVFFAGGHVMAHLLEGIGSRTFYQRDLDGFLEGGLLTPTELAAPPVNAGFAIHGRRLDWTTALARLSAAVARLSPAEKAHDLEKLEQSITHAAHVMGGSQPLDGRYVLQIDDRLRLRDAYAGSNAVMRHYVRPVRHKMWAHASVYLP